MVDIQIREQENLPVGNGNTWPAAVTFSSEQQARFAVQRKHLRDIWVQWIRLLAVGGLTAAGLLVWFMFTTLVPPGGVDEQTSDRLRLSLIRIETLTAFATLAVIATLTVAVSVVVRGLADPDSGKSQGIDEARRQFLTQTTGVLGCSAAAVATLAVVWNTASDSFGLPGALGLFLIAAATSAIAADSITVLGAAKSTTPAFACWLREQAVDRLLGAATRAQQDVARVDGRSRWLIVAKGATVLAGVGLTLGVGLLAAFPTDLVHTFWSIPDRLWRSTLAALFVGGAILFFGYRLALHWLLRQWWFVAYWCVMCILLTLALVVIVIATMARTPDLVSLVHAPTLVGGPTLVALLITLRNFGPARIRRTGGKGWLVRDLRRLRGGEVWRRIDKNRRANAEVAETEHC